MCSTLKKLSYLGRQEHLGNSCLKYGDARGFVEFLTISDGNNIIRSLTNGIRDSIAGDCIAEECLGTDRRNILHLYSQATLFLRTKMGKLGDILSHPDELIPLVGIFNASRILPGLALTRLGFFYFLTSLCIRVLISADIHVY